ncbi:MAG TPA: Hsp20 family protein [Candidatus Acidoferrum sp.]|nr:Hsp20 family protein [Candidatus Acidoferrum sp.]
MKESGLAVQPARDTSVQKVAPADLVKRMNDLYDRIAHRAYEIFEDDGRVDGHDFDDWLQAEDEFLHPLHLEVSETPEALTVHAEVPGFKTNDLEINVEPRRVTITGQRETTEESQNEKAIYSETCSDQILRVFDLPAAVDPTKVKATLKDGVLELDMPKAAPAKIAKVEPKAVKVEAKAV